MGLLEENGPCFVSSDSKSTYLNEWSWNNEVNCKWLPKPSLALPSFSVNTIYSSRTQSGQDLGITQGQKFASSFRKAKSKEAALSNFSKCSISTNRTKLDFPMMSPTTAACCSVSANPTSESCSGTTRPNPRRQTSPLATALLQAKNPSTPRIPRLSRLMPCGTLPRPGSLNFLITNPAITASASGRRATAGKFPRERRHLAVLPWLGRLALEHAQIHPQWS